MSSLLMEKVVFNESDQADFDAVQLYNGHDRPIQYCVFDLLWMDGHDLIEFSLDNRKDLLKLLIIGNPIFRFSQSGYSVDADPVPGILTPLI